MHLSVGPHRFSGTDARRTLAHAIDFLDEYPVDVHPYQAERRARLNATIAEIDVADAPLDALGGPLESVWSELTSARSDRVSAGVLPPRQTGRVTALATGDGGVPKRSIARVDVDFGGVVGDRQNTRNHHGAPFQALCLWNLETIDDLVAQGHPIAPGHAGENITIEGVSWASITPGVRLAVGGVLCEISSYAVPCAQNARWFSDRDFNRIHHRREPISRVYAVVVEPGSVGVGDLVTVEP